MTVARERPSGAQDFDFLFGSWRVANERLKARLAGSDEWERFEALATCRPLLGGLGNIDDFRPLGAARAGFEGGALRLFSPQTIESLFSPLTIEGLDHLNLFSLSTSFGSLSASLFSLPTSLFSLPSRLC